MDNSGDALWAMYVEAQKGEKRTQWLLFPPKSAAQLGETPTAHEGYGRFIKRIIDYKGHKAKWKTVTKPSAALVNKFLKDQLAQYESLGFVIKEPVLIRLEADDYAKAWAGKDATTPYKALRHVEAVTIKRGYRLTSD